MWVGITPLVFSLIYIYLDLFLQQRYTCMLHVFVFSLSGSVSGPLFYHMQRRIYMLIYFTCQIDHLSRHHSSGYIYIYIYEIANPSFIGLSFSFWYLKLTHVLTGTGIMTCSHASSTNYFKINIYIYITCYDCDLWRKSVLVSIDGTATDHCMIDLFSLEVKTSGYK
jgi:hypothetical protein